MYSIKYILESPNILLFLVLTFLPLSYINIPIKILKKYRLVLIVSTITYLLVLIYLIIIFSLPVLLSSYLSALALFLIYPGYLMMLHSKVNKELFNKKSKLGTFDLFGSVDGWVEMVSVVPFIGPVIVTYSLFMKLK